MKSFHFQYDLPENLIKNLEHEVDHVIRYHTFLA